MNEIVRLTILDLEVFLKSMKICFPDEETKREDWVELLEDEKTFAFAIKKNNEIEAHLAIYNWKGESDYVKIMSIGTHPDHRKKGHAHRLMQHVIDEMLKDGMYKFKGETRVSNLLMQKVFEDFGYTVTGKVEDYYENPIEAAFKFSLEK